MFKPLGICTLNTKSFKWLEFFIKREIFTLSLWCGFTSHSSDLIAEESGMKYSTNLHLTPLFEKHLPKNTKVHRANKVEHSLTVRLSRHCCVHNEEHMIVHWNIGLVSIEKQAYSQML